VYHVIGVNDSTSARLFVNGVLVATTTSSQTPNNFTISGYDFRIGNNNASSYYTGSLQFVKIYNRALTSDEVLQNYESTRERFNLRGIAIDPDASLFLRTAGITDTTQQSAIDTLVLELKNAGIWSKMKAIYPFVGGTASTHRWNLKDPRDVDAAFRLTFTGGWTHSSTGADPNGTNAYADTYYIPKNEASLGDVSFGVYNIENTTTGINDCGTGTSTGTSAMAILSRLSNTFYADTWGSTRGRISTTLTDRTGLVMASRTATNVFKAYRNGTQLGSTNTTTQLQSDLDTLTVKFILGAYRRTDDTIINYTDAQQSFAFIGNGLTDAEASSLYTIVQKYQTTLGRQV